METGHLEELYGPEVIAAIEGSRAAVHRLEAQRQEQTVRLSPARNFAVGAALTQAVITGTTEVFDPERNETLEEIDHGVSGGPDLPVTLFFVPNNPQATVAVVRPWLFPTPDFS